MDNEQIGTSAVIAAISKTNRLKAFVSSGDKEPSFDGGIYIYDNDIYAKKNIKRVGIQVKGKSVKAKIKDTIKYPISLIDLKNYQKNGGAIFFVVYFDKDSGDTKQIYYVALLPFKIGELLKNKQACKGTLSVKLKKFPSVPKEMTEIFLNFYSNAQKQMSYADKTIPSIIDLKKQGVLESISLSYISVDKTNDNILNYPKVFEGKELYLYANIKGGIAPIPVEYYAEISHLHMSSSDDVVISVNGIAYYNSIIRTITADKIVFRIGTSVTLVTPNITDYAKIKEAKIKVNVKLEGNLNERITALQFLIAMFKYECFEIDGHRFPAKFPKEELNKLNVSEYPEMLDGYTRALAVLKQLNVEKPLNIDDMNSEDFWKLNSLIGAIETGIPIRNSNNDLPFVVNMNIANIRLLMTCKKKEDNLYYIDDFFNKQVDVFYRNEDEIIPASQYSMMKADDFLSIDNLNLQSIINDYKRIAPHKKVVENGNIIMLEMLKAYDTSKKEMFLVAAKSMLEWIENNNDKIDREIIVINKHQIYRRERKLTFSEKQELSKIIETTQEITHKIGAFILLDEQDEAQNLLNTLEQKAKSEFMSYPIFKFYSKEEPQNGQT